MGLRFNGERAKIAIVLIWIVLGVEIISLISDYFQYKMIADTQAGKSILTTEMANANDLRQRLIAIAYGIVFLFSAVVFIRWFRRAYFNLNIKFNGHLNHSDGDAALYWFIPIVNLFRPFRIMKEMYVKTEALLAKEIENYKPAATFYTLGWWWALWIIHTIAGQIAFRFAMAAKTVSEIQASTYINMAGTLIDIPLALVAILVIQDYAEKESLLFNLRDENIEHPQPESVPIPQSPPIGPESGS